MCAICYFFSEISNIYNHIVSVFNNDASNFGWSHLIGLWHICIAAFVLMCNLYLVKIVRYSPNWVVTIFVKFSIFLIGVILLRYIYITINIFSEENFLYELLFLKTIIIAIMFPFILLSLLAKKTEQKSNKEFFLKYLYLIISTLLLYTFFLIAIPTLFFLFTKLLSFAFSISFVDDIYTVLVNSIPYLLLVTIYIYLLYKISKSSFLYIKVACILLLIAVLLITLYRGLSVTKDLIQTILTITLNLCIMFFISCLLTFSKPK